MPHDDRRYRVFLTHWDGDIDLDTVRTSCGTHLADVVDQIEGDSTRPIEVQSWENADCQVEIQEEKK